MFLQLASSRPSGTRARRGGQLPRRRIDRSGRWSPSRLVQRSVAVRGRIVEDGDGRRARIEHQARRLRRRRSPAGPGATRAGPATRLRARAGSLTPADGQLTVARSRSSSRPMARRASLPRIPPTFAEQPRRGDVTLRSTTGPAGRATGPTVSCAVTSGSEPDEDAILPAGASDSSLSRAVVDDRHAAAGVEERTGAPAPLGPTRERRALSGRHTRAGCVTRSARLHPHRRTRDELVDERREQQCHAGSWPHLSRRSVRAAAGECRDER